MSISIDSIMFCERFELIHSLKRLKFKLKYENLSNMPKTVIFHMVFVKNESGRIRVHPRPLYIIYKKILGRTLICYVLSLNTTYISISRMNTNAVTFI